MGKTCKMADPRAAAGQVISLADYMAPARNRLIAEVEDYWHSIRGARSVPLRSDVDPRGIERALGHAFIVEKIAPGLARFRVAGNHLSDLVGMEVRGMPLTSLFTPAARTRVSEALARVFEGPSVAEIAIASPGGLGRPPLSGTLILLPLKSDLGDVSRALGCLVTDGGIGRAPRRFEVGALRCRPVLFGTAEAPEDVEDAAPCPAAEAVAPHASEPAARVLRLVTAGADSDA